MYHFLHLYALLLNYSTIIFQIYKIADMQVSQSINRQNCHSATYKIWMVMLNNVKIKERGCVKEKQ